MESEILKGKNAAIAMKSELKNLLGKTRDKEKRFILLCAIVGAAAGLLAVAFRVSISAFFALAWTLGGALGEENRFWLMPLVPAFGAALAGLCVSTFAKNAAGSGIPQTKAAFYNSFGIFSWRDVAYRFVLGTLFCGSGNSAGREGPTVHMCSALSSVLAQKMGFAREQVRNSVPAGMGAGIAASFNAPLSAISFVFEELLGGFSQTRKNGGIILAVIIAAAVARIVLGENPVLPIGHTDFRTGWWMLVALPIAVIAGFCGDFFLKSLLKLRGLAKTNKELPLWVLAASGGLFTGIVATFVYSQTSYDSVFSVGYNVLLPVFSGNVCVYALLLILVGKFFATIVNYAMGGSGGLFSPSLVIGGMLGAVCGTALCAIFNLDKSIVGASMLIGMGAYFAAVIRCPITSILMIFELTLNYSMILPLIGANLLSYAIAKSRHSVGLYDSLLLQDGISLKKMPAYRGERDWAKLPVSAIMSFNPECVRSENSCRQAFDGLDAAHSAHNAYPSVDDEGRYSGMVLQADLRRAENSQKKCGEIAAKNGAVKFITPQTSIEEASRFFVGNDMYEVAVIDPSKRGKVIGILTLHDILRQQQTSTE